MLAGGYIDGTICIWDIDTNKLEATLEGHTAAVLSLTKMNPNCIASGSADGTIKIWKFNENKWENTTTIPIREGGLSKILAVDQDNLLIGLDNGQVFLFSCSGQSTLLGVHESKIIDLALLDKGVAITSSRKTIKVWDLSFPVKLLQEINCEENISCLSVGDIMHFACGFESGKIQIWHKSESAKLPHMLSELSSRFGRPFSTLDKVGLLSLKDIF